MDDQDPKNKVQAAPQVQKAEDGKTTAEKVISFDRLVRQKKYAEAAALLVKILGPFESGSASFGDSINDLSPKAEAQATVLCAAVTQLLSDDDFVLNDRIFLSIGAFKRALIQCFEISGYRGTEHLIQSIGQVGENNQITYQRQHVFKLFLGLSVNALSPNLVNLLLAQKPDVAWPLCVGFLSEQIVWSKNGQAARPRILAASKILSQAKPTYPAVRNLGPAYMGCSYDESAHKHNIKDAFNKVSRSFLKDQGLVPPKLPKPRNKTKDRPTVLVMAELYDSRHAMHRCYGPSIKSLKSRFHTILMTLTGEVDEALVDMFDEIDPTPFHAPNPVEYFKKAISHQPDIVYFPSIGMRLMSILGSNIRMAPIQMMTFGHPATTRSPDIDYAVLDAEQIGSPDTVAEKILCRASVPRFTLRHDSEPVKPILRQNPSVVRIAVPAWSRKVSPTFIQHCQKIEQEVKKQGKKVEFWFFPNATGTLFQAFSRRIRSMLTARAVPRTDYNSYIANLNQCDIFLSSFPFGATNGIVDAIRQGLPVVNLTGPEVHESNDSHIVARFEQPEWLTTDTGEEYVKAVVRLVMDGKLRVNIGRELLLNDPDTKLVSKEAADDFATVVQAAYLHHEKFQASKQRMWRYEELQEMVE